MDKLEKFIKSPGDLKFDLDTAISMCRQGGYYEQAAYLAKKHGEEDMVVDILIEDCKKYDEALHYIWQLHPDAAYPCMMKYARVLIENCPQDATKLFIDYYTGRYRPKFLDRAGISSKDPDTPASSKGIAASAVQNFTNFLPYMNTSTVTTPTSQSNLPGVSQQGSMLPMPGPPPKYTPPQPRTAFSSFIDHAEEFITFLESVLESHHAETMTEVDRTDLTTTLFEMYLLQASEKRGSARESWEAKAKSLISSPTLQNSDVLLLSHLSSFQAGTTMVKEQAGLLQDIFRSYTSAKDTRGALNALRKYGPREPNLYVMALSYLVSDARVLDEAGEEELHAILRKIDADALMAPLQVVQTLSSSSSVATMGLVKPYLAEVIERERKEIAANRRRIADFRQETAQRRDELKTLGERPVIFQATRCKECGGALELPAVHFLCRHSFHQRCLPRAGGGGASVRGGVGIGRIRGGVGSRGGVDDIGDAGGGGGSGEECPACKGQNAAIRAMKRQQVESRERHDLFKAEVERSGDRFAGIVGWFGRGVMGGG